MADTQAQYFHATLYAFGGKAVEAVIGTLHRVVDNVAVKCHYDSKLNGFELTCPQYIGPDANDALHGAICSYVNGELKAAEREDRKPLIERFQESLVDDLEPFVSDDDDNNEEAHKDGEQPAERNANPFPQPLEPFAGKPSFLHSVSDECSDSTLKLFNLRDTGTGMLERTLVHPGHKVQEAVYRGFTCRAARWDPVQGCYAFNGRSGDPIEELEALIEADKSTACAFDKLLGQLPEGEGATDQNQQTELAGASYWEFQDDIPTVNQYLDGMGKTELVNPETAQDPSELPSDARKYNAAPNHEVRIFGRSRCPAPTDPNLGEDDKQSEDEDDDDGNDSVSSACSESDEKKANPILDKFRNTAVKLPQDVTEHVPVPTANAGEFDFGTTTPSANVTSVNSVTAVTQTQTQTQAQAQNNSTAGNAHTIALPEYDRNYAKVDKKGLTGHAALQAHWEHFNPTASPTKLNKHGISRRPPTQDQELSPQPTSKSSTTMSLSTGPELQKGESTSPASSFSMPPPIAPPEDYYGREQVESYSEPWATRKQHSSIATNNLVDVSVPRSREPDGRVRPPPRFGQSLNSSQKVASHPTTTTRPSNVNTEETISEYLIDLNWEEPARTKQRTKLSLNDPPLKPTVRLPVLPKPTEQDDKDTIVERLQDHTTQSQPVRYTMRQKAARKKKGKASAATPKPKVQLPKPDPPPPPKPTASKITSSANDDRGVEACQGQQNVSGGRHSEQQQVTHIEKLLGQVEVLHGRQDVELEVSFGMMVVRPRNNSSCRENWSPSKLQERLQREEANGDLRTDFFERLTASASDARFMFALLPGDDLQPRVEYEVTVKLLQGETRTIKFDQKDPGSFAVLCPDRVAVTLYMHYPIRVHDGRSRVIRSELALDVDSTKVAFFISSISSLEDAPSFVAAVPTQSFSVDRVHIKRIFAKQIVPGVQLKVEEIQDLKLDPVASDKNFNFKAVAANRAFMIDNHRLWYECSLHLTPLGGVQGDVLQSLVDQMVAEIDGVGYFNKGPYLKTDIEAEPEVEIKFW